MSAAFNTIFILLVEALRLYFSKEINADYVNKCITKKMIKFRAFSPNLRGKKNSVRILNNSSKKATKCVTFKDSLHEIQVFMEFNKKKRKKEKRNMD